MPAGHHVASLGAAIVGGPRAVPEGRPDGDYAADYAVTRQLLSFLLEYCCQGHPEICGPGIADPAHCAEKGTCS